VIFPPDTEPLPPIEPGVRGQRNPLLGIVAAGLQRMGFSNKDEDRVAIHASWLETRRRSASSMLSKGKELPTDLSEDERKWLVGPGPATGEEAPPLEARVCFFCVLDGHGGDEVSEDLSRRLPAWAVRALSAPSPHDGEPTDVLPPLDTSEQLLSADPGCPVGPRLSMNNRALQARARRIVAGKSLVPRTRWMMRAIDKFTIERQEELGENAGTCVVAATIVGDALVVFNVGDCEAWLSVDGRPVELSRPHKAGSAHEVQRIHDAGGKVLQVQGLMRVEGMLAVSRSVGVAKIKKPLHGVVIPDPAVRVVELTGQEEVLIMGSDGLFDKFPRKQDLINTTKRFLRETGSATEAAQRLLEEAIDVRGSRDNASVVLVVFNQPEPGSDVPCMTGEGGGWGRGVGYALNAGGMPAIAREGKKRQAPTKLPAQAALEVGRSDSIPYASDSAEQDTIQAPRHASASSVRGAEQPTTAASAATAAAAAMTGMPTDPSSPLIHVVTVEEARRREGGSSAEDEEGATPTPPTDAPPPSEPPASSKRSVLDTAISPPIQPAEPPEAPEDAVSRQLTARGLQRLGKAVAREAAAAAASWSIHEPEAASQEGHSPLPVEIPVG
jgi:serine/threonine protein phosphatase PrpC